MKKSGILLLVLVFGVSLISFATGIKKDDNNNTNTVQLSQLDELIVYSPWDDKEAMMKRGEAIYIEKCVVCHQADGKGLPGAFPPLAKSDYLLEDPVRGVAQTLNGSHEEMVVNGVTYNMPMTPQVDTKEDAVAVINYVLKNFGNDAKLVTMDDVKGVVINPR